MASTTLLEYSNDTQNFSGMLIEDFYLQEEFELKKIYVADSMSKINITSDWKLLLFLFSLKIEVSCFISLVFLLFKLENFF